MSSRPFIKPFPVIEDGDMSADIISEVTILTNLSMLSYEIEWTGTSPIGNIIVQVSDSYSKNAAGAVENAGTWSDLPLSATTAVSGNSGKGFISITEMPAYAARLFYDRTSGVGTMNALVTSKVQ